MVSTVTNEELIALVKKHDADTAALMAATNLSRQALHTRRLTMIARREIRAMDWPRAKRKTFTDSQVARVVAMRKQGKSYAEIANAIGRARGSIPRLIRKLEQDGKL